MLALGNSMRGELGAWVGSDARVQVFAFPLDAPEDRYSELLALLSIQDRERAERFKSVQHRLQFVSARAGLRLLLGAFLDVPADDVVLETDEFGKPFVRNDGLEFNLTHAGAMAAIAITHHRRVGIDIEPLRPVPDAQDLAERFFAPAEVERLHALKDAADLSRAFLECWTRKEAFVKAIGRGLSYPLKSFEVSFYPDNQVTLRSDRKDASAWSMYALDLDPAYCGALVVAKSTEPADPPFLVHHCCW
jgi:4'-phosphopantetheinyl transferase